MTDTDAYSYSGDTPVYTPPPQPEIDSAKDHIDN